MTAHARLGASSAHRWLNCPRSVALNEAIPDNASSFAAEGTLAHGIAEKALQYYKLNKTLEGYAVAPEDESNPLYYPDMLEDVMPYLEYVITRYESHKWAELVIEQRLDFSNFVRDGFGTGDAVIVAEGLIEIIDLKFGKGVRVDAEGNPQLMLYGLGASLTPAARYLYEVDNVRMTIVQPRLDHVSTFTLSLDALKNWGAKTVKPIAELAYSGMGEMRAGEWCKFCKFKRYGNGCKVYHEHMQALTDMRHSATLTDEQLTAVLSAESDIKQWLDDLHTGAVNKLLDGGTVPGFKLVAGRSTRKIQDPEALAETLEAAGITREVIYKPLEVQGITNLEKAIGRKKFAELSADYVRKTEGKPTLAPESDKRQALSMNTAIDDFDFDETDIAF